MELVLSRLRGKQLRRAELCAIVIGTLCCGTMAFAMARFVWQNAMYGERSSGLISIPIWPVQAPAIVGLVLLALAMAEQLVTVWRGERPLYVAAAEGALASDDRHSAGI
jgi:TRAP-type C4-dicarboxylate transport system permease small subunit